MRRGTLFAGLALLFAPVLLASGQSQAANPDKPVAEVEFQFERVGLPVPQFTLKIREDGTGSYQAEQAERPSTANSTRGEAAKHIDRTIRLSSATVDKVFKTARDLNRFDMDCSSKLKNIADTGKKTMTYTGMDGHGSCVYHYSENKKIQMLSETFIAIAYTMDEGGKLEFLHRYDRLGLDSEMITFSEEADAGRAQELGTIAPTLSAIADDSAVIQRARLRAAKLLEQTK